MNETTWRCHTNQLKELFESPLHPQPNFETDAAPATTGMVVPHCAVEVVAELVAT